MVIDFPDHQTGPWQVTPLWLELLGYGCTRRINWRWTVDHRGCACRPYWEYR